MDDVLEPPSKNGKRIVWKAVLRVDLVGRVVQRTDLGEVTVSYLREGALKRTIVLKDRVGTEVRRFEVDTQHHIRFLHGFTLDAGRVVVACVLSEKGRSRNADLILDAIELIE